ncbi:KilA-N domain-containing protein [Anabaena sp. PCC 7108]|uniref:KilA-N domain-containing protein n=1 Tax=Anabaena sp. PCC 7108 TaxID=163908 RepID=UPI00034D5658|nr:KilA-N domain-containing protein [Anabaena sp. PCC 7108]
MNSITIQTHFYNDHVIDQLAQEARIAKFNIPAGYVNATQMCDASEKQFNDYARLKGTKAYWEALSTETGIPVSELVLVVRGGNDEQRRSQGTWVHPEIAIDLAQWVSVEFRIWANRELKRVIEQKAQDQIETPHNPPKQIESETITITPELPDTALELKLKFENHEIRFMGTAEDPWWSAADICAILEISFDHQTKKLDDYEKRLHPLPTTRGRQKMLCVNKSGFYSLILSSRSPQAKRLKKWVVSAIPFIREITNRQPHEETFSFVNKIDKHQSQEKSKLTEPQTSGIILTTPSIKDISDLFDTTLNDIDPKIVAQIKLKAIASCYPELTAATEIANRILEAPVESQLLNPTQLAQMLNTRTLCNSWTAQKVNTLLIEQGFQEKNPYGNNPPYIPTEKGKPYSRIILTTATTSKTTIQNLRWFQNILDATEI